jgi:hypothetical protein
MMERIRGVTGTITPCDLQADWFKGFDPKYTMIQLLLILYDIHNPMFSNVRHAKMQDRMQTGSAGVLCHEGVKNLIEEGPLSASQHRIGCERDNSPEIWVESGLQNRARSTQARSREWTRERCKCVVRGRDPDDKVWVGA